jgi:hypothetical protein
VIQGTFKTFASILLLGALATPAKSQDHMGNLCERAQGFVLEILKAPATARFQPCAQNDIDKTPSKDGQYYVRVSVDAQNSYGALLRNKYHVSLEYKGGRWEMAAIIGDNMVCTPSGCVSLR